MSIRVHNSEHFEELRQSALSNSSLSSKSRSTASPANTKGKITASTLSKQTHMKRMTMKHELYMKEQEAMQKKIAETIAENIQRQKSKKEGQFLKLQQEVEDGKILAKELLEKLELQQQSKTRQFSRMHEEWTNDVFHKLNDPILAKVQTMDGKQHSDEKAEAYQKFLDITNKKGGLFRDIIIASEYNPLSDAKFINHRAKVDDPVKRVIRRREEEDTIARNGASMSNERGGDLPSLNGQNLGRSDNLDVKLWSKGEFESTPYGYFHKMMNSTASSEGSKTYASHVKLDHYNIEKGLEVLRQELPKGKRTNFDGYKIPKSTFQIN
ncbi:hypothetical protein L917_12973 [Phytophthora nicotianae]|uniref:Uncharacterized protein n=4 Tax=Phytophthora nicotianae TaxID=4792 RepID=W2R5M7_PHYN3|nr:hypothetical protein PPTG_03546 [Phytophthora nicotianae INRA-310]ETI41147.1 hypothetical protein F443_13589 [Phytophthora nicotianae P1569]ETL87920.1 hypothetical protein L917_12973 [Phytophthora nicotianae]ETO69816.1 hypothetical protein F444_13642 [Phytophthora nicotianae P1976]KUF76255.1 hypothetical protein AM587_10011472 [Phytophthora nicotianae]ETM41135.1 hypothetical protein L914_13056 [Phytophthora nicotianae]